MALNIYVWIRGEQAGEVRGDSTVTSMNREGSIEAIEFEHKVQISREASGMLTGERSHGPITIKKLIDRSSPILHQILCNFDPVEVTIKFYRPSPVGDGTTEQFYTIQLRQGHISSIKTILPNTLADSTVSLPAMEEVSFVFGEITYTYSSGSTSSEHTDEWQTHS